MAKIYSKDGSTQILSYNVDTTPYWLSKQCANNGYYVSAFSRSIWWEAIPTEETVGASEIVYDVTPEEEDEKSIKKLIHNSETFNVGGGVVF